MAHLKSITSQAAVGHRHPILSQPKWINMKYAGEILYEEFNMKQGFKKIPNQIEPGAPNYSTTDNSRMLNELKIKPYTIRQSLIDMGNSFIQLGLLKKET